MLQPISSSRLSHLECASCFVNWFRSTLFQEDVLVMGEELAAPMLAARVDYVATVGGKWNFSVVTVLNSGNSTHITIALFERDYFEVFNCTVYWVTFSSSLKVQSPVLHVGCLRPHSSTSLSYKLVLQAFMPSLRCVMVKYKASTVHTVLQGNVERACYIFKSCCCELLVPGSFPGLCTSCKLYAESISH